MKKGILTRILLFFLLTITLQLTGSGNVPSLPPEGFNTTLSIREGKSTPHRSNAIRSVVIDAGHGGHDSGGHGKNCHEKDIALNVAKLLRAGIEERYPLIEVIMTREEDTFVPLYERARIANEENADLFISIHANTASARSAFGTETFVMGTHVEAHNLRVAQRENAVVRLESDGGSRYDFDPDSPTGYIRLHMEQSMNQEKSILFAGMVENAFAEFGRSSRGVKQAGFVVLKETTMPSVLVELGFVSNDQEESYLRGDSGQRQLAGALLDAFTSYHARMDGSSNPSRNAPPETIVVTTPPWRGEDVSPTAIEYPTRVVPSTPEEPTITTGVVTSPAEALQSPDIVIGLQLGAFNNPIDLKKSGWNELPYPVIMIRDGAHYKYQIRNFPDGRSARQAAADLKARNVDTVVVAYRGADRIMGDALKVILSK